MSVDTARVRHARTIQRSLPILIRWLGRRAGVEVVIGGNQAGTNFRKVALPDLPFEDPNVTKVAFGFAEHEIAHLRESTEVETTSHLHFDIYNAFEDVRAEPLLTRDFPGFTTDLRDMVDWLMQKGYLTRPLETDPPVRKLQAYLLYRLRADVVGQEMLHDYADEAEALCRKAFPPGFCTRLGSVLGRVPALRSSQEAADLAYEVIELLKDEATAPRQGSGAPPSDDDEAATAGTSGSQSASDDSDDASDDASADRPSQRRSPSPSSSQDSDNDDDADADDDAGQGSPVRQAGAPDDPMNEDDASGASTDDTGSVSNVDAASDDSPDDGAAPDRGEAGSSSLKDDGRDQPDANPPPGDEPDDARARQRKNLQNVLDASVHDFGPDFGQLAARALEENAAEAIEAQGGGRSGGNEQADAPLVVPSVDAAVILAEVNETMRALQARTRGMFASTRRNIFRRVRHGSQIDPARVARLAQRDPKIFRRRQERRADNTAVQFLLDRSPSMEIDGRLRIATRATLAMESALAPMHGVSVASAAFPGYRAPVEILTRFGESLRRTAPRYRGITPSGGTPLLPAIFWCAEQLLLRSENRRIIIVVTDGQPAEEVACREAIGRCWNGGIEVYGIGIRVPDMSALFPIARSITRLDELAPAMFQILEQALKRRPAA